MALVVVLSFCCIINYGWTCSIAAARVLSMTCFAPIFLGSAAAVWAGHFSSFGRGESYYD